MSLRGYCRTLSERIDCSPAIRITRLTTIARTGRLTNRSVNFTGDPLASVVFRLRRRVVAGLHGVVDPHGRAVAQLEGARAHDLVAGGHAGNDRDLVPARAAELHELLAHTAVAFTVRTLDVGDDED